MEDVRGKVTGESRRQSERHFRALVENSRDGVMLVTAEGKFTYASPYCGAILGHSEWELLNSSFLDLVHPDDKAKMLGHFRNVLSAPGAFVADELRVRHKDGSWRWLEASAYNLLAEPAVQAVVFNYRDINARKQAEQALAETNRQLQDALEKLRAAQQQIVQQERLKALGEMASGIAHDFNNALSPVLGYTEILLQHPEQLAAAPHAVQYLQTINTAAKDASHIVQRLRAFYRKREQTDALAPVSLNQIVEQAVSLTRPKWKTQLQSQGVEVHVQTELAELPDVLGCEPELREALTNLIFNAVDAMPKGGRLTLRTHRGPSRAVLEIADTGTGMSEEVRRHCFEPFFTTKGDKGTGLGLAMVHGIVRRHDGDIDIQSAPGRGTTFIIRLPIREAAPTAPAAAPATAEPASRALRVLVMDDEPVLLELVGCYLESDGHSVETAPNGKQGLEQFRKGRFDLVLTDQSMPGISGLQVAAAVKELAPQTPVILLTGFSDDTGTKPEHVDLVVNKPISAASLRAAVARCASSRPQP